MNKQQILNNFLSKVKEINNEIEQNFDSSQVGVVFNQALITKLINQRLSAEEKIMSKRDFINSLDLFKSSDENKPRPGYFINFELYEEDSKSEIYEFSTYEELVVILKNLKYDFISLHFLE